MTVETIAMFAGNVGAESRDNMRRKEVDHFFALFRGQKGTSGLPFPEGKDNSRGKMKVNPSFTQRP